MKKIILVLLLPITLIIMGCQPEPAEPTPLSANAAVVSIAVSTGTLIPVFDTETAEYFAPAPFTDDANPAYDSTQSVGITVIAEDDWASVRINGSAAISGTAFTIKDLAVGANDVSIDVTSEDGTATQSYTVDGTEGSCLARPEVFR